MRALSRFLAWWNAQHQVVQPPTPVGPAPSTQKVRVYRSLDHPELGDIVVPDGDDMAGRWYRDYKPDMNRLVDHAEAIRKAFEERSGVVHDADCDVGDISRRWG